MEIIYDTKLKPHEITESADGMALGNTLPVPDDNSRSSVFFCWTWNMFETTRLNMFDYTWWVISTPQKNMKVSWDDDISIHSQYMENKSHVPNHQLDTT